MDFILCDLLEFWQQIQTGLLRGDINLGHAGSALGDLAKPFIEQALQTIALIALNMAAKAALALPQNLRCLGLALNPEFPLIALYGFEEPLL